MKEVARLRCHVAAARPHRDRQQHDVRRGKACDGQASHQPLGLTSLIAFCAAGLERIRPIADVVERVDHLGGIKRFVAPANRQPPVGEVEPGFRHSRQFFEPVLNLADTAGAADTFYREVHVGDAVRIAFDEQGKITRFGHGSSPSNQKNPSAQNDALLGAEQPFAVARKLDDEVPLPR